MVLAQVHDQIRGLGNTALQEDGRHRRVGHTDLEPVLFQAALERTDVLPELLLEFGMVADQLQTLQRAHDHRHRERLGVELPTHVVIDSRCYSIVKDSVVLLEQLRTIDKQRLREKVCHLEEDMIRQIDEALRVSLDITRT